MNGTSTNMTFGYFFVLDCQYQVEMKVKAYISEVAELRNVAGFSTSKESLATVLKYIVPRIGIDTLLFQSMAPSWGNKPFISLVQG